MAHLHQAADQEESKSQTGGPTDGAVRLAFRIYKAVFSPVLHAISPSHCIYLPTCSEYAYTAVSRFGIVRGSWMLLRRFACCHPWGKGGLDPVPERLSSTEVQAAQSASSGSGQKSVDHLP
jgi:putative membrane protein insertion efficiency factor